MTGIRQRHNSSKLSSCLLSARRTLTSNKACFTTALSLIAGIAIGHFLTIFLSHPAAPNTALINRARNADILIDVDIGTCGTIIDRDADKLLTFDPFDKLELNDTLERYPFVIADFSGTATFYKNLRRPSCSTMNLITTFYNETLRDRYIASNCPNQDIPMQGVIECAHPNPEHVEELEVQVRRLSDLLKERGFTRINSLKIDAQGTDFLILKDVLENAPHVDIDKITIECQDYSKTIPLYVADNDCVRIEEYVLAKFPDAYIKWQMNVCWSEEYNLIISNITTHTDISESSSKPPNKRPLA